MTLDRNSKLVKFSYFLNPTTTQVDHTRKVVTSWGTEESYREYSKIPFQTSLCAFFWRTFVFMPLAALAVVLAVCGGIYGLGLLVVTFMGYVVYGTLLVGACALALWEALRVSEYLGEKRTGRKIANAIADFGEALENAPLTQITLGMFKAFKTKACPIIRIE